ncbi:glucuronate isomerase [Microbulbifer thermotolerans]|uniref:Uronate isomerase n=1 Tax=Microbulbifer thermotolerans TaxID=252514 RepID=A0A143HIE2_MICTH|nr:glucuronate isomerase [Microbulbifer thermotolerans]AMX01489.1 glucuronate isomerase [Microbulbifer thermotolerans]MCX2778334.1 glucuronate isomerase [Microbulbifer thermotolerans]MCX2796105.1 glucuronate isomerase [Microbulbifer thermotolerans]MCX2800380.1 glucuronate isomerase [Microbulbifer thermotolerans]MCX2804373.1 glucuronate isomerase [Microbulbifer thermotolerans]
MTRPLHLHPDRLFPADKLTRDIARRLYESVKDLPIISPHGHTDPAWFADNQPFGNPAQLLIKPDHYVFRMLYSQGIPLERLGIPSRDGTPVEDDPRAIWQLFADNYHLFRGTPSRIWLDSVFHDVFELDVALDSTTAGYYYEAIDSCLKKEEFLPRALFERFRIEVIATTESPLDDLRHHQKIKESGWSGRVITAFRPDPVLDPDYESFTDNLDRLAEITGEDTGNYTGYLAALRNRREFFKGMGATSTDHGHPTATTANLDRSEAEALFNRVRKGNASAEDAELFRGQMLTEMARMSLEDGLVMQIHPGSVRNHNPLIFERYGRDKGADIPSRTDYVHALRPLLEAVGNEPDLTVILFTLDETSYSRELAPLAGHYPALKLGPAWWFHDSPEGMRRFREQVTETAGFYNTVGFNDDTRAFLSIPARHDVARRMDCTWLAQLVAEHRLAEDEAFELAHDLSYALAKRAYKL